jgi:hypothetical protein
LLKGRGQWIPLSSAFLSPFKGESAPAGAREGGQKTTHIHQKAELFHTFRLFYAFAPLCLLQEAGTHANVHACLGPVPIRRDLASPVAAPLNTAQRMGRMRKRQGKGREGASIHLERFNLLSKEISMTENFEPENNFRIHGTYSDQAHLTLIDNRQSTIDNRQSTIDNRHRATLRP